MKRQHSTMLSGTNVEVRNDDVNGALRRLRKVLERDNQQKYLARLEYYEKPGVQRKKAKAIACKRWKKQVDTLTANRILPVNPPADLKFMKSKRKRRKRLDQQTMMVTIQRKAKSLST